MNYDRCVPLSNAMIEAFIDDHSKHNMHVVDIEIDETRTFFRRELLSGEVYCRSCAFSRSYDSFHRSVERMKKEETIEVKNVDVWVDIPTESFKELSYKNAKVYTQPDGSLFIEIVEDKA